MIDDVLELFRGQYVVVYFLIVLPVTLSLSPPLKTGAASAAVVQELKVFRLQHFDLQGNQHGSRAWRVNFEAVSLNSRHLIRRCLVLWWKDLNPETLHQTITSNLGAALIILPESFDTLDDDKDRQLLITLEERLLEKPFAVPVYIALKSPTVTDILRSIEGQGKSENGSAWNAMISSVIANGYQLVSANQAGTINIEAPIYNIVGKLAAYDRSDRVSSIAIVAHYDSFGLAPALSYGADSNGSGVAALLELLRIFSKLYQTSKTRARYNMVFLLSAGGKLNYQGARQWIDEHMEQIESGHSQKLEFAMCFDSLAKSDQPLNMHVSKIPKETSSVGRFHQTLQNLAQSYGRNISMVQKKINLGEEYLAWEHERFSIKKLYAFTLSHYDNHRDSLRWSIIDTRERADMDALFANTQLMAEALARHVFEIKDNAQVDKFFDDLKVERENLKAWIRTLSSRPRSMQMLVGSGTGSAPSTTGATIKLTDPLLNDLYLAVEHYSHEAHASPVKTDKRDPDYLLYGATIDTMFAYRVKPALFDLILALIIAGHLGLIYLFILNAYTLQLDVRNYLITMKAKKA